MLACGCDRRIEAPPERENSAGLFGKRRRMAAQLRIQNPRNPQRGVAMGQVGGSHGLIRVYASAAASCVVVAVQPTIPPCALTIASVAALKAGK